MAPAPHHMDKTMRSDEKHCFLEDKIAEPAVVDELEKKQKIDSTTSANIESPLSCKQHRISSKLRTTFVAGTKIHQQNFPPEPVNYCQLAGHPFEKQFPQNMEAHMREHQKHFRSWETVSSQEAKGHQVIGYHQGYNTRYNIIARSASRGRQN